ncbi:MAG: isochorismatase family cysteine hydrolase [Nitrososphaerota archaeon]|nr:cysteine hydrolase [Candidatus Calditenuis fumarioli]
MTGGAHVSRTLPEEWRIPQPERVRLDPKRDFLVVVDLQKEYCHPSGRKYLESSREIVPNVIRVLEAFRSKGAKILFTAIYFDPEDPRFRGLESRLYPRKGEWGFELIEELAVQPGEIVVEKDCYDPFLSSNIDEVLRSNGLSPHTSTAVVTGAVTTTCVYHTVSGLFHRGYRVVVPVDCVADRTPAAQLFGLWKFVTLYNVKLTKSDMIELV